MTDKREMYDAAKKNLDNTILFQKLIKIAIDLSLVLGRIMKTQVSF